MKAIGLLLVLCILKRHTNKSDENQIVEIDFSEFEKSTAPLQNGCNWATFSATKTVRALRAALCAGEQKSLLMSNFRCPGYLRASLGTTLVQPKDSQIYCYCLDILAVP